MTLKSEVTAVLNPVEAVALGEALNDLAGKVLSAEVRWRVMQLESVLCEKVVERDMDEP